MPRLLMIVLLLLIVHYSMAQAENKSQYTLRNPTPHEFMREMSTDRPDKTESPYTVDAGHYQIEMSFIDYQYDHDIPDDSQHRQYALAIAPINMKAGLFHNMDIQLVLAPYTIQQTNGIDRNRNIGFGDIQTRLKINVYGNDDGPSAMAVMPFLKFPTSTDNLGNDDFEGGIILPIAFQLPRNWNMGLMSEFDFKHNSNESGYHTEFINSLTLGHAIIGNLSGYVEFFSNTSMDKKAPWLATVDTGLTYALTSETQLDLGVNVGVTRSAPDLNPFCGLTVRY